MKVLFLNVTGGLGGAERLLLDVLASLRQADPSLELHLALGEDGPLAARAEAHGVVVHPLPLPPALREMGDHALSGPGGWRARAGFAARSLAAAWAAWRYAAALRRLVRGVGPDVVHSNSAKLHLLTGLGRLGVPVVWHLHDFPGARVVMTRLLRLAGRVAGAVAISEAVGRDARGVLPRTPVVVAPNAIDTEHFCPDGPAADLDALAGLAPLEGAVRVGLVATYATWKGHDVFLEAAGRLARERPELPVRFYVVGGPIYQTRGSQWARGELRQRAAALLAENRLGFIDFQADCAPVYRALDVVAHASTRPEPFGLTIAEAMSCGRAVIVSRAGGAAELFTQGHDAVGVDPGDVEGLAGAVGELAGDADRRRRLGHNARRTALGRFGRQRLGGEILRAYAQFGVPRAPAPQARKPFDPADAPRRNDPCSHSPS